MTITQICYEVRAGGKGSFWICTPLLSLHNFLEATDIYSGWVGMPVLPPCHRNTDASRIKPPWPCHSLECVPSLLHSVLPWQEDSQGKGVANTAGMVDLSIAGCYNQAALTILLTLCQCFSCHNRSRCEDGSHSQAAMMLPEGSRKKRMNFCFLPAVCLLKQRWAYE